MIESPQTSEDIRTQGQQPDDLVAALTVVKKETALIKVLNSPEMLGRIAERAKEIDPYFPYGQSSNAVLIWLLLEQARILIPFGSTTPQVVAALMQPTPLGMQSLLYNGNWRAFPKESYHGQAGDIWTQVDAKGIPIRAGLVAKANPLGDFILSIDTNAHEGWKPYRLKKEMISAWVGPS